MILKNELIVDNYSGGGGASVGIEMALKPIGRAVDIAVNHCPSAIDMHTLNHPNATHYCESAFDVDPVIACNGRPVGLGWFSPDCRHFSKAKGAKPVDRAIRGLAWLVVKWGALVAMRIFKLENVEEFLTWGPLVEDENGKLVPDKDRAGETFEGFILTLTTGMPLKHPAWKDLNASLFRCNYDLKQKLAIFKAAKYGLGYNVKHDFMSAHDYGVPTSRRRLFMVGRNDGLPVVFPKPTHGPKGSGLLPYRTAAEIIDWSLPARSIFDPTRSKPVAKKSLERLGKGVERFVVDNDDPFFVEPEMVVPFITEHANASSQRNMAINEPLRTLCAQVKGGHFALVACSIVKYRGDNVGHKLDEPLHTISAGGNHLGLVKAYLVKYYGNGAINTLNNPLDTISTRDRFGLVIIKGEKYQIVDIAMRMLQPHELFLAMGFPADYIISHNSQGKKNSKADQVARCGNAVCPPLAAALVAANVFIDNEAIAA